MKGLLNLKKVVTQQVPRGVTVVWKTDPITGERHPVIVPRKGYLRRVVVKR